MSQVYVNHFLVLCIGLVSRRLFIFQISLVLSSDRLPHTILYTVVHSYIVLFYCEHFPFPNHAKSETQIVLE